jgi:hypothetical protein
VHDYNGGTAPSGLFWTIQLPESALELSPDGNRARLHADDVPVIDSFTFGGSNSVPAKVSFDITWESRGEKVSRGRGLAAGPKDPAAFSGMFSPARATGTFSGSGPGFGFTSTAGASTDPSYAEMGTERNGSLLK